MSVAINKIRGWEPRQKMCWDFYIDPKSETFGNAYQSAMRAGYPEATASSITLTTWFKHKLRRLNMLDKAEDRLDKILTYEPGSAEVAQFENKDVMVMSVQATVAKHVTKTLGKDEGWAERLEQTGRDGAPLPQPIMLNINAIQRSNRNPADNGHALKDPGSAGRDIGEQDSLDSLVADKPSAE